MQYIAVQPLQCNFGAYTGLDGYYLVEEYKIIPCRKTALSAEKPWQTLVLMFPFNGFSKKQEEGTSAGDIHFKNSAIMARKAKKFVAWLVVATGVSTRLFYSGFGGITFGRSSCVPSQDFQEEKALATFQPDLDAKPGKYEEFPRPDLSERGVRSGTTLKLPSDMPPLTRKLFSLPKKNQKQYYNACSSFQFGLENWGIYPTITLVALVSAVESMMADEFNSQFCEGAKKNCNLKRDVTKKFRVFFERTLVKPLPKDLRSFLNKAFSRRSSFVHRALLGEIGLCGPYEHYLTTSKLYSELRILSRLVRAGLIQWLIEV